MSALGVGTSAGATAGQGAPSRFQALPSRSSLHWRAQHPATPLIPVLGDTTLLANLPEKESPPLVPSTSESRRRLDARPFICLSHGEHAIVRSTNENWSDCPVGVGNPCPGEHPGKWLEHLVLWRLSWAVELEVHTAGRFSDCDREQPIGDSHENHIDSGFLRNHNHEKKYACRCPQYKTGCN